MQVVTFSSVSVWMVVVSIAAYAALFLSAVLCFLMLSLRKQVSARRRDPPAQRRSQAAPVQQVQATSEVMSAEVARWAHSSAAPSEAGGPGIPPGPGVWSEQAEQQTMAHRDAATAAPPDHHAADRLSEPWASHVEPAPYSPNAPTALPSGRNSSDHTAGRQDGAIGVVDPGPQPHASPAVDRLSHPDSGRTGPVSGGIYIGGNGKGQDRAQVTFNPARQPLGWYAYAVVCDGVGGIGDGAVAADTALASFSTAMQQWLSDHPGRLRTGDPNRITASLEAGVRAAHIATRELSRNPLRRGSSTTLDAALVIPTLDHGTVALVTHVGDGTLWTLDTHGLHRLPTDSHAAIPRPLGADLELSAELRKVPLPPGTRLVLTSDGFEAGLMRGTAPGAVDSLATVSSIAATLTSNGSSSAEIAHCIGGLAAANSPDDVTVLVVG